MRTRWGGRLRRRRRRRIRFHNGVHVHTDSDVILISEGVPAPAISAEPVTRKKKKRRNKGSVQAKSNDASSAKTNGAQQGTSGAQHPRPEPISPQGPPNTHPALAQCNTTLPKPQFFMALTSDDSYITPSNTAKKV